MAPELVIWAGRDGAEFPLTVVLSLAPAPLFPETPPTNSTLGFGMYFPTTMTIVGKPTCGAGTALAALFIRNRDSIASGRVGVGV